MSIIIMTIICNLFNLSSNGIHCTCISEVFDEHVYEWFCCSRNRKHMVSTNPIYTIGSVQQSECSPKSPVPATQNLVLSLLNTPQLTASWSVLTYSFVHANKNKCKKKKKNNNRSISISSQLSCLVSSISGTVLH